MDPKRNASWTHLSRCSPDNVLPFFNWWYGHKHTSSSIFLTQTQGVVWSFAVPCTLFSSVGSDSDQWNTH